MSCRVVLVRVLAVAVMVVLCVDGGEGRPFFSSLFNGFDTDDSLSNSTSLFETLLLAHSDQAIAHLTDLFSLFQG